MNQSFADRLFDAVQRKRTPVMVGIDPRASELPDDLNPTSKSQGLVPLIRRMGKPLFAEIGKGYVPIEAELDLAEAYRTFSEEILRTVADLVPIVKFQSAFFEAIGPLGMLAMADAMRTAKERGLLVVLDGKRNDIGSTAEAYAGAYLGGSGGPWASDAMTINPFLGCETLDPFVRRAEQTASGVFVLVRTSNPGSNDLQSLSLDASAPGRGRLENSSSTTSAPLDVSDRIADWVESYARANIGKSGYGPVGAVVGATHPEEIARFRERMPHAPLLLPGYGAQGGSAADTAAAFDANGFGAVVNNSRGIIFAHKNPKYSLHEWTDAVRAATEAMIQDLAAHTPAGNLR